MKFCILILLFISNPIFSQKEKIDVLKTETIYLKKFKGKNVVLYDLGNVKVCVKSKDYLKSLSEKHIHYKQQIEYYSQKNLNTDRLTNIFNIIDSVKTIVEVGIKSIDTIRVSHTMYKKLDFKSVVAFDAYIDKGNCAVFENKGKRRFSVIRQEIIVSQLYLDSGWGGRRYFFNKNDDYFLEAIDYMYCN